MKNASKTKWGDKANRRLDILVAARQQLEISGYAGLSMRDIAKSADVSPGLLYAYFANKEELFATLYAERLSGFRSEMLLVCQRVDSVNQLFVELLRLYLPVYQVFGREFNLFSLLRQTTDFSPEIKEQLTQTAIQLMQTLLLHAQQLTAKDGVELAQIPQADLVLPMFWIVLNGLAEHFSGERQSLYGHDQDTMASFIVNTLLQGLRNLATSSPALPTASST